VIPTAIVALRSVAVAVADAVVTASDWCSAINIVDTCKKEQVKRAQRLCAEKFSGN
jgi:hypothetical protein